MAKALECEQLNNGDPLSQHFPRMSLHTLASYHLLLLLPWILKCMYVVNIISLLFSSSLFVSSFSFSTFGCGEVCLLQAIDDTKQADEL